MADETLTHDFDIAVLDGDGTGSIDYYTDRQARIQSGEPTWVRRSFDDDPEAALTYDFFKDGQLVGSVSHLGWPYPENHVQLLRDDVTANIGSLHEAVTLVELSSS